MCQLAYCQAGSHGLASWLAARSLHTKLFKPSDCGFCCKCRMQRGLWTRLTWWQRCGRRQQRMQLLQQWRQRGMPSIPPQDTGTARRQASGDGRRHVQEKHLQLESDAACGAPLLAGWLCVNVRFGFLCEGAGGCVLG